jgi:O-antigen ligase
VCPNPIVGAGFESFWNGYGKFVTKGLSKYERGLNSAHDGYIEVYLNLGWIGVALIGMLLVSGYFRAQASFRRNPRVGSLMLGLIASTAIYSITEAGFRIMTPTWIALLLVCAGARSLGLSASREWDELGLGVPDESQKTDSKMLLSEPFTEAEPDPSFATQNARFRFSKISSGNRWI